MTAWHRSWLFVPADDERKLGRARSTGADALILDLEDSVTRTRRSAARELVRSLLDDRASTDPDLWVRINPIDSDDALEDLASVVRPGLGGVVVPKVSCGADVVTLGHHIDALEVRAGMPRSAVGIMAVATETPQAVFRLGELAMPGPRLHAVSWGAEDLAAAVGALSNKESDGSWGAPFELVRSLALHAAAAAGAQAVDTLHSAFRDDDGLRAATERAARHGFTGKLAIHPSQIEAINAGFSVSADDLRENLAIIAAFDTDPTAGVVAIDGRMYDRPHLVQAQRIVERAQRSPSLPEGTS